MANIVENEQIIDLVFKKSSFRKRDCLIERQLWIADY